MLRTMRIAVAVVVTACLVLAPTATSVVPAAGIGDAAKLRKVVDVPGMKKHEQAFQNIASANNNTRSSGTPGFAKSVEYVVGAARGGGLPPAGADVRLPVLPGDRARGLQPRLTEPADVHASRTSSGR